MTKYRISEIDKIRKRICRFDATLIILIFNNHHNMEFQARATQKTIT